jgi:hypothetical protein
MSSYYDDDRGSRRQNGRGGRTRESEYQETSNYSSRGGRGDDRDARQTSLVRRRDDSVSSVEEIDREFAPGSGYVKETTVRKHGARPARARSYSGRDRYNDDYDDRTSYAPSKRDVDDYASSRRSTKRSSGRNDRRSRKYDSDSESSRSRTPPRRRDRRKSTTEQALGALGLGGVAGALLGKKDDRSRSRDRGGRGRDREYSSDRSRSRRSRSRGGKDSKRSKSQGREKIIQSLKAAALAGATEAFRARKEPGGWTGAKGKRILTAAVGAAGVDGLITGTSSGDADKHSTRHIIESAIGGLAAGRLVNGPRSQSRGRGRSPSQSRGGPGDLVSGGILAAGAKKLYDRARSKSRRRDSSSSYDSRSPRREKKRSKSISDYARNGLASLGIGGAAKEVEDRKSRRAGDDEDEEYYHQKYNGPDGYSDSREVGQPLPLPVNGGTHIRDGYDYGPHHTGDLDTDSDSDLGSSSGEEKERKKGTGKQLLTAGLATIATIHAAHSVYQSAEKHDIRAKELRKGEISKAEARRQRNRGYLQDAASVGIAALGMKGAMSEWMETKEHQAERKKVKEKFMRHRAKRAARREKQLMLAERYQQSGFSGSMPNLSTAGNGYAGPPPRTGPTYYDDNPFAATSGPGTLPPAEYLQTPPGWTGR